MAAESVESVEVVESIKGTNLDGVLQTVYEFLAQYGFKVIGALLIFLIGRLVAKILSRWIETALLKSRVDKTLAKFIKNLSNIVLLLFVVIAALAPLGVETAQFAVVLGAAGLAIGLALQGTLSNVAAGVMLLIFRPFKVGDLIEAGGGPTGKVESIGLFSTTMNTPDNIHIVIPNSAIYGGTIHNYTHHPIRRVDLVMGISYDDDIGLATKTIQAVLEEEPRVLKDPPYQVAVAELADSSVNLVVRPWCSVDDYWGVRFDVTRALKERLEAAGCSIPYPQQDVHMHTVE